MCLFTYKVD
jgi:hypothetical protein